MSTEILFAKTFLSLLDTKPSKITPDHVEDPRGYPASTPVCFSPLLPFPPLPSLPPSLTNPSIPYPST